MAGLRFMSTRQEAKSTYEPLPTQTARTIWTICRLASKKPGAARASQSCPEVLPADGGRIALGPGRAGPATRSWNVSTSVSAFAEIHAIGRPLRLPVAISNVDLVKTLASISYAFWR